MKKENLEIDPHIGQLIGFFVLLVVPRLFNGRKRVSSTNGVG